MRTHWRQIVSLAALVVLGSACGCVSSKQEARKQATAHWQQVRSSVTLQMAEQQLEKGQTERARDSLQDVLRGSPDDARAHLLLARVLFEMRDMGGAQAALTRARRLSPDLAEVDYWQGVLAQASGEPAEAHAAYQAACSKAQDSAAYLCALLEAKLAMGDAEAALAAATARLQEFPRDARLRMLTAAAAAQQGDLDLAEKVYEQALDLDPSNEDAREGLAQVLCLAGRYERAASVLEGLAGRDDRKDVRLMLGACHLACGRYDKALRVYEACAAEDPDSVAVRLRLNEARLLSGQAARAQEDLQSLVRRHAREGAAWELLGHAMAMEGKYAQARQAYVQAGECGGQMEGLREYIEAIDVRVAGGVQRVAGEGEDRSMPANGAGVLPGKDESMAANNAAMAPRGEHGPQASRQNDNGREDHASAR
jgi:Tfp pilus assembly protein PilF